MSEYAGGPEPLEDVQRDVVEARWGELSDEEKQQLIDRYWAASEAGRGEEPATEPAAAEQTAARLVVEADWNSLPEKVKQQLIEDFYREHLQNGN